MRRGFVSRPSSKVNPVGLKNLKRLYHLYDQLHQLWKAQIHYEETSTYWPETFFFIWAYLLNEPRKSSNPQIGTLGAGAFVQFVVGPEGSDWV